MRNLTLTALEGIPEIQSGDDLVAIVIEGLERSSLVLSDGDVLVLAQKIVSKSEGREVELAEVVPSQRALELAAITGRDARMLELVLGESTEVIRCKRDVIVVEHRLGYVMANAGIDLSNVAGGGETALLLPLDPDASCERLRASLRDKADVGIVINDSFGRAWRNGVAGVALGVAGLPGVVDMRGRPDRFGRALQVTQIGFADELASAASLLMGQANEGYPVIHARGVPYARRDGNGRELLRPKSMDLFR
ncbi:MAG: coenzyme F420-0:L-glutamate ligase [Burkholderiales bacterium]|nr:coenzyme F420-0:L-glutamate ligase [Burkholderiales bacterium]